MGAHSSHHEPLDRNRHGKSFCRTASMRQSKSKANKLSPNGKMDRLRRSFRDSFRRRRSENSISEASRPQQWQSDEMDVRAGTCFFHVKYLGSVEVFESRGMQVCEEALRKLNNRKKRPIKAILYVSGDGLRVVEDDTKGLIVDQTIEKVSFCAPDRNHERGFSYICRDGTTRRWLCHGFLSIRESGERLSHAVGCAFAVCLERKQKRDRECNVTMNFDLTSATFTRTGSFKQASLTDRLQDTTNVNNNVNSLPTTATVAVTNNTTSNNTNTMSTTTVININNNISTNNCYRKENIPIRSITPRISTKAIERPHASVSLLQRQGSYRGLSHLNHASPFKRQLSLRISDLPSNMERTRCRSMEYAFDTSSKTLTQLSLIKNAVSPIPEASPTTVNVSDQVSAMCQKLSQGLSLLSKNDDDLSSSTINQSNSTPRPLIVNDLFAQKADQRSSQFIELQPAVSQSSSTSTFLAPQRSFIDDSNVEQSSLYSVDDTVTTNGDANVINNNNVNASSHVRTDIGTDNDGVLSQTTSIQNVPLTPPSTPPLQVIDVKLPKPDQWLGKVAQITFNESLSKTETITTASTATATVTVTPPPQQQSTLTKKTPSTASHTRAYSLSSAETAALRTITDEKPASDPFNIDWVLLAGKTPKSPSSSSSAGRNTNPFLTNSPRRNLSDQPMKTFEVQM